MGYKPGEGDSHINDRPRRGLGSGGTVTAEGPMGVSLRWTEVKKCLLKGNRRHKNLGTWRGKCGSTVHGKRGDGTRGKRGERCRSHIIKGFAKESGFLSCKQWGACEGL